MRTLKFKKILKLFPLPSTKDSSMSIYNWTKQALVFILNPNDDFENATFVFSENKFSRK